MIMNDLKKDPKAQAVLLSLGNDNSVTTFVNANGQTTGQRPCTVLYKGKEVRANVWESVVSKGVKLNEECTIAVSKWIDKNNKVQYSVKVIAGNALVPTEELFGDLFEVEAEMSI